MGLGERLHLFKMIMVKSWQIVMNHFMEMSRFIKAAQGA
jgi:hypothetical protein